jgi:hypothetical protein
MVVIAQKVGMMLYLEESLEMNNAEKRSQISAQRCALKGRVIVDGI